MNVRTRIAPSPTGFPHIGTIYQVLFDFVFARQNDGKFILRIEDTDRARFVEGAEDVIYNSLEWFGLVPDESPHHGGEYGPYRQSERLEIYKKHIEELLEKGHAYYCFCTRERLEEMRAEQMKNKQPPMYDKTCLRLDTKEIQKNLSENISHVVRMKVPEKRKIILHDLILGTVEFDSAVVDDQVLYKSDGFPTYHLGVVVDDHLMKISHVFRGREWVSSTPKHILLYEYFGWDMPIHAHLPLMLNTDGKGKLSKRHGHASVDFYKDGGFLPEAVLNYLSNVVWNHPDGKEIYSLSEFTKLFDMSQLSSQGARFDLQKLTWVNQQYILQMREDELLARLKEFIPSLQQEDQSLFIALMPLVKERMTTLRDFTNIAGHFFTQPTIQLKDENEKDILRDLQTQLSTISEWKKDEIFKVFKSIMDTYKIKMPVLYRLLTGSERGLPLPESLEILGKEKVIDRIANSLS